MGQMQTKILGQLRKLTEAAGLDFADQPNHANTGTVYVQTDDFATVAEIRYDFQNTYASIVLSGEGVAKSSTALKDRAAQPGTKVAAVRMTMLNYGQQADMGRLFGIFAAILTENGHPAKPAKPHGPHVQSHADGTPACWCGQRHEYV